VVEPDAENHCDTEQRRERGKHLAALDLGQHRGRETGVRGELHQPQFLLQAQRLDAGANRIAFELVCERVG
jgi:hypothetical protein